MRQIGKWQAPLLFRYFTKLWAQAAVADGVVVYTPHDQKNALDGLAPKDFRFLAQIGDSLGDRLLNATRDLLTDQYDSVCLINSDSPTFPPEILVSAIEALGTAGDRLVLGPAEDGGYYLKLTLGSFLLYLTWVYSTDDQVFKIKAAIFVPFFLLITFSLWKCRHKLKLQMLRLRKERPETT